MNERGLRPPLARRSPPDSPVPLLSSDREAAGVDLCWLEEPPQIECNEDAGGQDTD